MALTKKGTKKTPLVSILRQMNQTDRIIVPNIHLFGMKAEDIEEKLPKVIKETFKDKFQSGTKSAYLHLDDPAFAYHTWYISGSQEDFQISPLGLSHQIQQESSAKQKINIAIVEYNKATFPDLQATFHDNQAISDIRINGVISKLNNESLYFNKHNSIGKKMARPAFNQSHSKILKEMQEVSQELLTEDMESIDLSVDFDGIRFVFARPNYTAASKYIRNGK